MVVESVVGGAVQSNKAVGPVPAKVAVTADDPFFSLGWDDLIRQAKQTSAALRNNRNRLPGSGGGGGYQEASTISKAELLAAQVQEQLETLSRAISVLSQKADEAIGGMSQTANTGNNLHILQRHRDILAEYRRDYKKTMVI